MAQAIPLIRAAVLVPFRRWMAARGQPIEVALREAGLSTAVLDDPMRPIALASGLGFFGAVARREAPDIGCQVVAGASIDDVSIVARALDGARTPRETLARAAAAMPLHCSHEGFAVHTDADGVTVREFLHVACDPIARHTAQQFAAGLVQTVCALTGHRGPFLSRLELVPHPAAGLAHLEPWFGSNLAAAPSRGLAIRIPNHVLDRLYPQALRERLAGGSPQGWSAMRADGSFAGSVRVLIEAELIERVPDAVLVASAAGISLRTLQRRLAAEGTSFSRELDAVRRTRALDRLAGPDATIGEIAATLGYSGQSGLTRAVRRWTGAPPSRLRRSPS